MASDVTGSSGDVLYYYVSYARLGPLLSEPGVGGVAAGRLADADPDLEVEAFFKDLDEAVGERTGARGRPTGFYDRQISYVADPRQALAEALGRAQVFLPLYSPSYLGMSWTRRELDAFHTRMRNVGHSPDGHVLPVLWTPVPGWGLSEDDREAIGRASDLVPEVTEYAENGLRALCVLGIYAEAYRRTVREIAARIVRLVRDDPVATSAPLDLASIPVRPTTDPAFVVAVLTAARPDPPEAWHPYSGRQDLPVAEYATRTAERLGLSAQVVDFDELPALTARNPALVLVDPGLVATKRGLAQLRRAFVGLPVWARPLVVGDGDDDLARRAQWALSRMLATTPGAGMGEIDRIDGPRDLERKLPLALARARQSYLKEAPYGAQTTAAARPRLSGGHRSSRGKESDVD